MFQWYDCTLLFAAAAAATTTVALTSSSSSRFIWWNIKCWMTTISHLTIRTSIQEVGVIMLQHNTEETYTVMLLIAPVFLVLCKLFLFLILFLHQNK